MGERGDLFQVFPYPSFSCLLMGETDNRGGGIPIMSIHRRIHQEGRIFGWNTSVGWRLGEILMVDLYLQFLE